jgi:hypothetical protein
VVSESASSEDRRKSNRAGDFIEKMRGIFVSAGVAFCVGLLGRGAAGSFSAVLAPE